MIFLEGFLESVFFGNSVRNYLYALGIFFVSICLLYLMKNLILKRFKGLAGKTKNNIDDIIILAFEHINWFFYFVLSFYLSLKFISIPEIFNKSIDYILIIFASFYIIKLISIIIDQGAKIIIKNRIKAGNGNDSSIIDLMKVFLKISLWIIGLIWILSNLGFNVASLIAGLGIGGIAIALALQNVLSDIFASFSIYFDKPFRVGDFIVIGNDMGIVQKIGIKTTRLKTLQGEELVISNKELTESRVHNYKKMDKRRVVFNVGVTYDTPVSKIKKVPGMIKKIFDKMELATLDRVHFNKFNDSNLNFEIVYYVDSSEYNIYMDKNQDIHLAIKELFDKEKIEFAFPTSTVHLVKN